MNLPIFSAQTVWSGGTVGYLFSTEMHLGAGAETGLLHSADLGRTWQQVSGDQLAYLEAVTAFSNHDASPILLAGGPGGLLRSSDAGVTWHSIFSAHVHTLTTCVGRQGESIALVGTESDGVLRSDDAGQSWTSANAGLLDSAILSLVATPCADGRQTLFAGTPSGISISRNDGRVWRPGLTPDIEVAVQCFAVSPDWATNRTAFAGTESSGLLHTSDGGLTWESVPSFAGRSVSAVAWHVLGNVATWVLAATGREIVCSTDRGESWTTLASLPDEIATLWLGVESEAPFLLVGCYERGLVRLALG